VMVCDKRPPAKGAVGKDEDEANPSNSAGN
jgi:hypothetical protein